MRALLGVLFLIFFGSNVLAATAETIDAEILQQQRIDTVKDYVRLLGRGSYQELPKLFTNHAVAVSANGDSDSVNHFYESLFLKKITKPQAKLINVFNGQLKNNMMTAYYNLTWVGSDGILVSKKFLDLFIFQADSTKIKTVYVFSNDFHESAFDSQDDVKVS